MAKKLNLEELEQIKNGLLIWGDDYPKRWVSKSDCAKILGVHRDSITRWVKKGLLTYTVAGISTYEILKLLKSKK